MDRAALDAAIHCGRARRVVPGLRHGASVEELREYYLQLWPKLLDKWVKAKAVETAFASENPLGQWRNMIQEIHGIKLPLPSRK